MSLAQLLAEHSRDINANISHSNEMASDNAERKANTLEEKFQHAKDSIESAGGEIAATAGAYHLGRKIYSKYQARKAQKVQSNEDGKSNNSNDAQKEAPEPEGEGEAKGQGGEAEEGGDTIQTGMKEPEESDIIKTQPLEDDSLLTEAPKLEEPTGDLQRNIASDEAEPEKTTTEEKPTPEEVAKGAEQGSEVAENGAEASELTESGAKDLAGATKSVAGETADNVLSKVAGAGGDALTAGLDTASAVLDALGPVGEVAGVITSLVGLFEGLHHHKKEVQETGESDVAQTTAEAGLDPKALLGSQ